MLRIGGVLAGPVESVPAKRFGVLGGVFGLNQPSSSTLTRTRINPEPGNPSLLEVYAADVWHAAELGIAGPRPTRRAGTRPRPLHRWRATSM
jgi:hypothetical protein